jgi:ketosteroid isomerase-like protein
MSEENVQRARRIGDLFNAGEIENALAEVSEDFEMDWSNSIGPLKGIYRGHDGARELWRSFTEAWESIHWEPEEIIDLGEERLIVVNHVRMRGRDSGAEVSAIGVQEWTFKDGVPTRIKLFQSKADALEAAGLSE